MAKPTLVRVKLEDGGEASVGETFAKSHGLTVLNKPATRNGRTLPAKPKTSVAKSAVGNTTTSAGSDTSASSKEVKK